MFELTPSECGGDGIAMSFPWSVDVSPDGNFVYLGTIGDQSVVAFARNKSTGRIKPLPAPGGCLDSAGTDGCTTVPELGQVFDLQVGPGSGSQIYVSSPGQSRVLVMNRSGNTLSRRAGVSGCVSQAPVADCADGSGLTSPEGLALSPDGQHLYVASADGVAELSRTSTGGLAPRNGSRFCIAEPVQAPCATLRGLAGSRPSRCPTMAGPCTPRRPSAIAASARSNATRQRRPAANGSVSVAAGSVTTLPLTCTDSDGDIVTRSITSPPGLGVLGPINEGAGT